MEILPPSPSESATASYDLNYNEIAGVLQNHYHMGRGMNSFGSGNSSLNQSNNIEIEMQYVTENRGAESESGVGSGNENICEFPIEDVTLPNPNDYDNDDHKTCDNNSILWTLILKPYDYWRGHDDRQSTAKYIVSQVWKIQSQFWGLASPYLYFGQSTNNTVHNSNGSASNNNGTTDEMEIKNDELYHMLRNQK